MSNLICRLCVIQDSTFFDIFNDVPSIIETLRTFLGITICPEDNWPKSICTVCYSQIQNIQTLMVNAKNNEALLASMFGDYVIEEESANDDPVESFNADEMLDIEEECIEDETEEWLEEWLEDSEEDQGNVASSAAVTDLSEPEEIEAETTSQDELQENPVKAKRTWKKFIMSKETQMKIRNFYKMECPKCQKTFPSFSAVKTHFKRVHKCPGYIHCCKVGCKGRLLSHKMLYDHMMKHIDPVRIACEECDKICNSQKSLELHRIHKHTPIEERKYGCDRCPKRFSRISAKRIHMYSHVPEEEKKYTCEHCGKAFAAESCLATHIRNVHTQLLACEVCGKVCKTKYLFEKHMLKHKDSWERNIPCPVCGMLFYEQRALQKHQRRHNTSGSLVCHHCSHVSVNQQALRDHIERNHTKVKIYKCPVCEKEFKRNQSLKDHWAAHLGMKSHQCKYCPKRFTSYSYFSIHRKKVHPDEWQAESGRDVQGSKMIESGTNDEK